MEHITGTDNFLWNLKNQKPYLWCCWFFWYNTIWDSMIDKMEEIFYTLYYECKILSKSRIYMKRVWRMRIFFRIYRILFLCSHRNRRKCKDNLIRLLFFLTILFSFVRKTGSFPNFLCCKSSKMLRMYHNYKKRPYYNISVSSMYNIFSRITKNNKVLNFNM